MRKSGANCRRVGRRTKLFEHTMREVAFYTCDELLYLHSSRSKSGRRHRPEAYAQGNIRIHGWNSSGNGKYGMEELRIAHAQQSSTRQPCMNEAATRPIKVEDTYLIGEPDRIAAAWRMTFGS